MATLLEFFSKDHGLPVGEAAPDLVAIDQHGVRVQFAAEYERGPVLIYFYVRAETPICTAHACHLRDRFEFLRRKGVQVFGVSGDPVSRLGKFANRHQLQFRLLSDHDGAIADAFRVPKLLGFTARDAYLIRNGRIAWKGRPSAPFETFPETYFLPR